ncbi:hypothetical protein [Microtetraspora sp. NBRC 13810]|uniref:hypothetical protein n=1 Tax=Microtetraspora sp. NBRC 13810 TaxID=3030990 RepID=UPI002553A078|nr:hypothetical protein [Microtetraspora sp. NBRC 13810]
MKSGGNPTRRGTPGRGASRGRRRAGRSSWAREVAVGSAAAAVLGLVVAGAVSRLGGGSATGEPDGRRDASAVAVAPTPMDAARAAADEMSPGGPAGGAGSAPGATGAAVPGAAVPRGTGSAAPEASAAVSGAAVSAEPGAGGGGTGGGVVASGEGAGGSDGGQGAGGTDAGGRELNAQEIAGRDLLGSGGSDLVTWGTGGGASGADATGGGKAAEESRETAKAGKGSSKDAEKSEDSSKEKSKESKEKAKKDAKKRKEAENRASGPSKHTDTEAMAYLKRPKGKTSNRVRDVRLVGGYLRVYTDLPPSADNSKQAVELCERGVRYLSEERGVEDPVVFVQAEYGGNGNPVLANALGRGDRDCRLTHPRPGN